MLRFLILLLTACLAAPAVASDACEPPPAEVGAQSVHGHHAPPSEAPAPAPEESASHGCIGCIPPASAVPPGAGDPLPPCAQAHGFPPAAERARTGFAPIPPPPRSLA